MANPTFTVEAVVLKKTKLKETDLIITLLTDDGSLMQAVAKGARKPQSTFSSHLELYNNVRLLCAKGRNLDIVKESRLLSARPILQSDPLYNSACAAVTQLVSHVAQPSLNQERLYLLTRASLDAIARASSTQVPALCAAALLKTMGISGMRPELSSCIVCSTSISTENASVRFSSLDGGVLCATCTPQASSVTLPMPLLLWAQTLLRSTYDELLAEEIPLSAGIDLVQFAHQWIIAHAGIKLKAVPALLLLTPLVQ